MTPAAPEERQSAQLCGATSASQRLCARDACGAHPRQHSRTGTGTACGGRLLGFPGTWKGTSTRQEDRPRRGKLGTALPRQVWSIWSMGVRMRGVVDHVHGGPGSIGSVGSIGSIRQHQAHQGQLIPRNPFSHGAPWKDLSHSPCTCPGTFKLPSLTRPQALLDQQATAETCRDDSEASSVLGSGTSPTSDPGLQWRHASHGIGMWPLSRATP